MDFTGCNANIYTDAGELPVNVRIQNFDKEENTIEVPDLPDHITGSCEVVILQAPLPYAYMGTVRRFGGGKFIALYEGRTTEQRKATRYKTNHPCIIEHLYYDGVRYELHTPLKMQVINISKDGLRLCGKLNDLVRGLCPVISLNIGDDNQILTAKVVNNLHKMDGVEEFGCLLFNPGKTIHNATKISSGKAKKDDEQ